MTLKGLYYNHTYNPATDDTFAYRYMQPHLKGLNNPYEGGTIYQKGAMPSINKKINDILLERFGKGLEASERNEKNLVTKGGRANVWYIVLLQLFFVVQVPTV